MPFTPSQSVSAAFLALEVLPLLRERVNRVQQEREME